MVISLLIIGFVYQVFDIYFDSRERKKESKRWFKNKWIDNIFYWGKYILAASLLLVTILEFFDRKHANDVIATRGKFKALKMSNKTPVICFGNQKFSGNNTNISFGTPVEPLKAERINNQISLHGYVRDSKGDVIAVLMGRGWEVTNTEGIEYNNDPTALEIRTGGRVIFQLQLTKDTVYYTGMLCDENGRCFFIHPQDGFTILPKLVGTQKFILPPDFELQPIFRYPRYEYLGNRRE